MRPKLEALGFTAAVLAYIWVLRGRWSWTVWVVVLMAVALAVSGWENRKAAGLSGDAWLWLAAGALAAAAVGEQALLYWTWCTAQQAVLQIVLYRRLRAAWWCGILFAAVHLPNPVLTPATLLWGAASCRLFERFANLPALGIAQTLFSWGLLAATPRAWQRNFRIGPGYFDWSSSSHTVRRLPASLLHP